MMAVVILMTVIMFSGDDVTEDGGCLRGVESSSLAVDMEVFEVGAHLMCSLNSHNFHYPANPGLTGELSAETFINQKRKPSGESFSVVKHKQEMRI